MLATDDGVGCHQRSPSLMPAYPFQHQSSPQKFTSHHDGMPSALLASPETPISCSFPAHQMPQSLPTPNPSPERPGPFHSHNLPVHFPHYPHFAPPTPQPEDQKVPVKRKPGRPPKSAAQKAADAAARKAISSPKKSIADKQNPKVPSKTGNPRGRPRKQVAQPPSQAKSDISLGEPASIRSKDSALTPFTGLHSPPAEEARQFKKRRLWSSDEQQLQSVAFDGLPTPPGSSGSDSSLSPSLAASSSSSVTFQRQIDPTSGQCVYVQHQPTPSLSSSCSTAPSTSASPSLSQFLIQRLDDSEALVKAEVNGLGTFLIQWSCLRDRLGLDDALEAVAAGLRKPAVEEASVVCEKILRKYCTNKCLPVHELSSLEQQEKTDRFKRWLQLKDDDLEMDQGIPVLPLSPDSTLPEISEGSPSGMQGGKSVTVLRRHGESSPAQQQQQSLSTDGGPDADGELDTPFEFDHLLPNSPQSIDEERADSNTTPVHDHSAFSVFTQANRGGPGMTRQPTLVESSPVVRATPKITYQPPHHHHERKVSWGYQPELLPPFPSTPPPSGDFFGKPRGRVASGKLDMWDAFDYSASPQYQTPGSFLSSVTATPDRGAMARQLGLFPASTSSGYAYTPGPFSR